MKLFKIQKNKAFTIIEALIAITILSVSVVSMLGVTASSVASAKYANNDIAANYLLQEAVDSVRNSRDTIAFQMKDTTGYGWAGFLSRYSKCFTTNGCMLKMDSFNASDTSGNDIISCSGSGCQPFYYDSDATNQVFYNLINQGILSNFKRTVKMVQVGDEVKVTVTLDWKNGTLSKSRVLEVSLLNWQK